ncbi:hypothetical protein ABLE91_05850 [Aquabacter sp. CN5-332]|uniref:hypothetical protein n=1 Tax=Aquabacter sp. CN5-332 TaxID=3156608 RepID=UPI0032B58825
MSSFLGLSIQPHNDLHLDDDGNLVVVVDAEAIGQHIRQRLMFWQGEWFLDQDAGVAWTEYVLGRPPSEMPIAEATIKAEVMATPGVTEILEFDASYDRASRGLRINGLVVATVFEDTAEIQF